MAAAPIPSPERFSVTLGLCLVMLATLPRYAAGGFETRQTLMLMALACVAVVALVQLRLLDKAARAVLPRLLKRLVLALIIGVALMTAWYAVMGEYLSWQMLASHGTTLGLILHALGLWWGQRSV